MCEFRPTMPKMQDKNVSAPHCNQVMQSEFTTAINEMLAAAGVEERFPDGGSVLKRRIPAKVPRELRSLFDEILLEYETQSGTTTVQWAYFLPDGSEGTAKIGSVFASRAGVHWKKSHYGFFAPPKDHSGLVPWHVEPAVIKEESCSKYEGNCATWTAAVAEATPEELSLQHDR